MSSKNLQGLLTLGVRKLERRKFSKAATLFSSGIAQLASASSAEDIELKASFLLQRSLCALFTDDRASALADADAAAALCSGDAHRAILGTVHLRRGQVNELGGALLCALREYSESAKLGSAEGEAAIARLFRELSIPLIGDDDARMAVFRQIPAFLLERDDLIRLLQTAVRELTEEECGKELLEKLNASGCCRIFYAAMQLYIADKEIVSLCLHVLTVLAAKGVGDVWSGYVIQQYVLEKWADDRDIFVQFLGILQIAPTNIFEHLMEYDFVGPLYKGFGYDLSENELQTLFYLMYQIANNEELLLKVLDLGIVDICIKKHTSGAMMFLSKVSCIQQALKSAVDNGVLDWTFELLEKEGIEVQLYKSAMIVITRYLLSIPLPQDNNVEVEIKEFSSKVFDDVLKVVLANSKIPELAACAFATLSLCIPFAHEKVVEKKAIKAASVFLVMYMNDVSVANNLVTFLYECVNYGYIEEIKNDKAVISTLMKTLAAHPDAELLVERAVVIACEVDHPNKKSMLQAALLQFPDSLVLQKYVTKVGTSLLK